MLGTPQEEEGISICTNIKDTTELCQRFSPLIYKTQPATATYWFVMSDGAVMHKIQSIILSAFRSPFSPPDAPFRH